MTEMDEKHPENKPREFEPEFHGIVKNRSCTDVICLIIFIAVMLGEVAVAIVAFSKGDPRILIKPTDSEGNICGEGNFTDRPNLFFFDLVQCARAGPAVAIIGCGTPQVCVKQCPTKSWTFVTLQAQETAGSINLEERKKNLICRNSFDPLKDDTTVKLSEIVIKQKCAAYYLESKPLLQRCLPSFLVDATSLVAMEFTDPSGNQILDENNKVVQALNLEKGNAAMTKFLRFANQAQLALSEVKKVYQYIIAILIIAMIASFIWCLLLNWFACIMVVFTLSVCLLFFTGACAYCIYGYFYIANSTAGGRFVLSQRIETYTVLKEFWLGLAISAGILALIVLIIVIFLRNRIRLAIAIIREASKAITCIMSSLFFPLIPFILVLGTVALWMAVVLYLASTGTRNFRNVLIPTNNPVFNIDQIESSSEKLPQNVQVAPCTMDMANVSNSLHCYFTYYGGNEWSYYLQAYNIVATFWLLNFVIAFGEIVLAGAFASWYWAWSKPKDVPALPILASVTRVLRYHLGTIAVGSFIITLIQIIRAILAYIQSKVKGVGSCPAKFCICLCQCCFWCLEKIMRFINKNAYIVTAMLGKSFCPAAANAFFLILRNCLRLAVVDNVTGFVLFVGKVTITAGITALSFYFFSGQIPWIRDVFEAKMTYVYVPIIICAVGTFVIASIFFSVMAFAVDTLFICVMEDLERNDGTEEKPYYMSQDVMKVLGSKNKFKDTDRDGCCACCSCCCC
ncbi:hypothetical protein Ciccas_000962 [Cichlidogyrus casuarinus]|uniref:Choline transporter-like protein n=1 Tax=Cichlidogyrus casuarinus TaxID=1844966 RepID=A0ABD2QLD6_9PLAT